MSLKGSTKNLFNNSLIFDFLKGIIVALLLSLGLIILFAFSLKWFNISDVLIAPITLVIKAVCVAVGSIVAIKGESKGLLKGVSFGAIYMFFAFVIFSILSGSFSFSVSSFLDICFAALLGGLVGIIKVNRVSKI